MPSLWPAWRYPLLVFAGSRALVLALVAVEGWTSRPAEAGARDVLAGLGAWDGEWYRLLADHGYDPTIAHGDSAAFRPLYPLALRALAAPLPGVDAFWAGLVVSHVAFAIGLCLVYRLGQEVLDETGARRAVLYLAIAPFAFVFSAVYAESLFLALAAGCLLLATRGRMWSASGLGALALLTRPIGLALAPALAWRAWVLAGRRRGPALWRGLLPIVLLPAAELALAAYLWWRTGDPLATAHAQERGWGRGASFPPWLVIDTAIDNVWGDGELRYLVHYAFVALWTLLVWVLWRQRAQLGTPNAIFATVAVLMPFVAGSLVSAGRFGLSAFPVFFALAFLAGRIAWVDTTTKVVSGGLLATFIWLAYDTGTLVP